MHVLAINGSPHGIGHTEVVLQQILRAAEADGAETSRLTVDPCTMEETLGRMDRADAIVLGSPVYRASVAHPVKILLDHVPRAMWGETTEPLRAKPVAVVLTGASLHHFLALDSIRNVLATFFAAYVIPPGLYVPREGFDSNDCLLPVFAEQAEVQARALLALCEALQASAALRTVAPQA